MSFKIKSSGISLPSNIVYSEWFDELNEKEKCYTENKTNLIKRRYISEEENALTMGKEATLNALEAANLKIEDIDCIIFASGTDIQSVPYNASIMNAYLENKNKKVTTFDVSSTCLSFVTAMDIADKYFKANIFKNILIIVSEATSTGLDFKNIEVSGIFGDGAAAFVLEEDCFKNKNMKTRFETHAKNVKDCVLKGGGTLQRLKDFKNIEDYKAISTFDMNHKSLLKLVLTEVMPFWNDYIKEESIDLKEIKKVIPHQGSFNILKLMEKKLNLKEGVFVNRFKYNGNQVAASIPTILHLLLESGELKEGEKVLLIGTSAGVSFGVMDLEI